MFIIQTLNKIAACGLDNFDTKRYSCGDAVENPDAVLVRSASMLDMQFGGNLAAIARAGAGVNNVPVERCSEQGIAVFNTPGANANAVKEMVLCALFMASRKVADSLDWCKTLKGEGDAVGKLVEKGKSAFAGPEIAGKTLGIIGLGAIGTPLAKAAAALGMHVIGFDVLPCNEDCVTQLASAQEVFAQADYISLHAPLNDATRGMVNAQSIANMKDEVRILNFARGELVDDNAILAALESGKAAAYVTDFPTDAQIGAKGVTALPHLGASTPESEDNCAIMAAQELIAYLEKGEIKNSVNLPNTDLPCCFQVRVCIIHKDAPGIAEAIAAALDIPQGSLISAAKKGMAYTVADLEASPELAKLTAIDGVVRVRVLTK